MLVAVDAAHTVHAMFGQVERPAVFALVFVDMHSQGSLCELSLAVGKSTLLFIPAMTCLNPIFAHLGLVLSICVDFRILGHWGSDWLLVGDEGSARLARVETLVGIGGLGNLLLGCLEVCRLE